MTESDDMDAQDEAVMLEEKLPADEARMLRLAIDEVRSEPVPEPDWDRVERELMAAIDEESAPPAAPVAEQPRPGTPYLWAVVAAAAAAMLFMGWSWRTTSPSSQARAPEVRTAESVAPAHAVDVRALAPSSVVEAGKQTVAFTLAGVVTWKLSPGGRAVVDTVSVPHEIRLERGRIDAEVNPDRPGQPREAFAIRAGDTRVAVRGTVFSVERTGDRVTVAVSRGKVAVGHHDRRGPTELLVSPAEEDFDLQGRMRRSATATATPDDDDVEEGPDEDAANAPTPTVAKIVAPPARPDGAPEDPSEKTVEPARLTVGQARASMLSCLDRALHGRPDGSVTVASTVTVVLGPKGRIDAVRFSPPLEPDLQSQCSGILFGQHLEGDGSASFAVRITK